MAQVQICDRVIVHQTTGNHADFVILQQIARQGEGHQGLGLLQSLSKGSAVWKLHAKHGSVIVHAGVPQAVSQAEVCNAAAPTSTNYAEAMTWTQERQLQAAHESYNITLHNLYLLHTQHRHSRHVSLMI